MPAPKRRPGASPNVDDLAALRAQGPAGGRLRKAPVTDPVLGVASAAPVAASAAHEPPETDRPAADASPKVKVGFYQRPRDSARARAAFSWTRPQEGHRSFSDFIAAAVMREVERLEAEYHEGEPWPSMEAGELPTGKPLGP